jgi:formate/nitrite transporter FocA (FNT family)
VRRGILGYLCAVPEELEQALHRAVSEGERRLGRSWPELLATGAVGGIDVSVGILALVLVEHETGSRLLGALAFGIGFIALTLANSELFTENFLVPVMTVAAKRASAWTVARLWAGTIVTNIIGGWVMVGIVVLAQPDLRDTARQIGEHAASAGFGWTAFASAMLGGAIITLMTWMERSTDSVPAKLVAAVSCAFLLAGARLQHAIVISLEMFAALQAGASFSYLHWLAAFGFAAAGNILGGLGLVTVLRLVQVGSESLEQERHNAEQVEEGRDSPLILPEGAVVDVRTG